MLFEVEAIEPGDKSPDRPSLRAGESYPAASPSRVTCEKSFRSFNTGELTDALFGSPKASFQMQDTLLNQ
jgi:hypothetical protein